MGSSTLELVQLLDGAMVSTVYGGPEVEMIGQWTCRTEMYSDRIGMARIINPNSSTMSTVPTQTNFDDRYQMAGTVFSHTVFTLRCCQPAFDIARFQIQLAKERSQRWARVVSLTDIDTRWRLGMSTSAQGRGLKGTWVLGQQSLPRR